MALPPPPTTGLRAEETDEDTDGEADHEAEREEARRELQEPEEAEELERQQQRKTWEGFTSRSCKRTSRALSVPPPATPAAVAGTSSGEYEQVALEGGGYKRRRVGAKHWQYMCEHDRDRKTCKECRGSAICEHGRRRTQCKECGGSSI